MGSSIKDLIVRILVDDAETEKFDKAGGKAANFGNTLDKSARVGAGALALLAGGAFMASSAAADAEQSQSALQFALDQFPATADTNAEKLYALNSALALKTQYDDDAYASGQAVLAQYGLTGDQLEKLTPLLGDYAAKTGKDLPTAAEDLGKALFGSGKALKTIGIDFADAGSVGANYDQIMAGLTSQVGGFAEVQGGTAVGANAIFKNSTGELMETLGQELLPLMVDVTRAGIDFMTWAKENSGVVKGLATTVGVLAGAVVAANAAYKGFALVQGIAGVLNGIKAAQSAAAAATAVGTAATTANTVATWANNAAWYANPVVWIIAAIIIAIGLLVIAALWLYDNWDAVTKWVGEAFANLLLGFQLIGAAISSWWNGLWSGIAQWALDTFGPMIEWIQQQFGLFQLGLRIIGDGIASWWNGLWSGIGSFFASFWAGVQDLVRGAWNGIIGWIEGGVNNAVGLINALLRGVNAVGGGFGIHLNLIPNVSIPRLATGGITNGPQLAMVGDNPGGREAILPLNSPAARELLGGDRGPTDLSDSTIEKLARVLAGYVRVQARQGTI